MSQVTGPRTRRRSTVQTKTTPRYRKTQGGSDRPSPTKEQASTCTSKKTTKRRGGRPTPRSHPDRNHHTIATQARRFCTGHNQLEEKDVRDARNHPSNSRKTTPSEPSGNGTQPLVPGCRAKPSRKCPNHRWSHHKKVIRQGHISFTDTSKIQIH